MGTGLGCTEPATKPFIPADPSTVSVGGFEISEVLEQGNSPGEALFVCPSTWQHSLWSARGRGTGRRTWRTPWSLLLLENFVLLAARGWRAPGDLCRAGHPHGPRCYLFVLPPGCNGRDGAGLATVPVPGYYRDLLFLFLV